MPEILYLWGVTGFRISEYTIDPVFIADPEISPVFSKKRKMPAPQNCRIRVFKLSLRILPFCPVSGAGLKSGEGIFESIGKKIENTGSFPGGPARLLLVLRRADIILTLRKDEK